LIILITNSVGGLCILLKRTLTGVTKHNYGNIFSKYHEE
jgi:hypothetical protein